MIEEKKYEIDKLTENLNHNSKMNKMDITKYKLNYVYHLFNWLKIFFYQCVSEYQFQPMSIAYFINLIFRTTFINGRNSDTNIFVLINH